MSDMDFDEEYQDDGSFEENDAFEEGSEFEMEEEEDDDDVLEDDYELDGDDMGFSTVMLEKNKKRIYEVDFTILSIEDIVECQNKEITHVSNILGLPEQQAATLLRFFRWNKESLIERYMDTPEKILSNAGILTNDESPVKIAKVPGFVCDICCDDDPDLDTVSLPCNHRFCINCYQHYLVQKIKEEGESRKIQCPGECCNLVIDAKTVELLVSPTVYERYRMLLNRTYVDDNDHLRWCPAPNCEYAVSCHIPHTSLSSVVPTVVCKCGHTFCFGCGVADHQPCICALVKQWIKKCEDDSETANWISANTKECPACHSTIEKNGGCNHMTCRKCRHEFCWVCMGPWSEHGTNWYNCNRYDEKSSTDARDKQADSRATLERYLHYYNRYANHEQSAKLDREMYSKTEKKMEEMQQTSDLSWIEVQFLKRALDTVVECRMTLKWTYAFAFYLARNNMTALFEDNQRDLEMAVEQLSELLETPIAPTKITELKQNVLDKSVYVASRREVVLEDTAKGLSEGRWEFIIDLK
ncbi:hypothetical protein K7432_003600 [Basidiobolus ranarum]|uniref:RBR-type E3 ubiquitin transferase n=1 Tax=Basidiobolus ranarum TaxID=34480 RepID=A0ABR2W6D5_9FUNG